MECGWLFGSWVYSFQANTEAGASPPTLEQTPAVSSVAVWLVYVYECMRARSDVTRHNCIGCSNHTFGRVIIHFADRVWGKRSNPGE